MERRDKVNYYLDLAKMVAQRSTCLRRHYGAVIVKNDEVIATGYVGAPRGRKNCTDVGECIRTKLAIPRGERYELCRSVHAETNAIISASRDKMIGSAMYLTGVEADTGEYVKNSCSCSMCKRQIINAGIETVYVRDTDTEYRVIPVQQWIDEDESLEGTLAIEKGVDRTENKRMNIQEESIQAEERDMASMPIDTKPSPNGRLLKEMAVYELLEKLDIPYLRLDHEAAATVEDCHEVDSKLGIHICKNLFLCNSQKTDFYMLMMPGTKKFKTKELSNQIGSARLSFAGAEYMEAFLDITPGSVSVMGLMNDKDNRVRLLIDRDILADEFVGCHPCVNTSSLKIRTQDILEKFLPYVRHDYTAVTLVGE